MTDDRQSERATVMLTPDEKADVRLVAAFERSTESDVLRSGIEAVTVRASKIRGHCKAA